MRELGPNPKLNVPLVNVARKAFKKSVARLLEARSDPNMKAPICFSLSFLCVFRLLCDQATSM